MTKTSLLPDAAAVAGIEFPELCEKLVRLGLESWNARRG
jgi:D-alanine-D-alanine ligase